MLFTLARLSSKRVFRRAFIYRKREASPNDLALAQQRFVLPVVGATYRIEIDGCGLGKDNGIQVTVPSCGHLIKGADIKTSLADTTGDVGDAFTAGSR